MNQITSFLIVAVVVCIYSYICWRLIKRSLDSAYKAYDVVFLTAILTLIISRLLWVGTLTDPEANLSILRLMNPIRFGYLYAILPLLAVISFYIVERIIAKNRMWARSISTIIYMSHLGVVLAAILEIFMRLSNNSTENIPAGIISIIAATTVIGVYYRLAALNKLSATIIALLLMLDLISAITIVWLLGDISSNNINSSIIIGVIYFISAFLVYGSVARVSIQDIPLPQRVTSDV